MGFGKSNEVKEGGSRKFFTGVENFNVVAVNPTKAQLEELYGREISYEPEYIGTQTVSDSDGEREVPQVRLDFYLNNNDGDNPITTKASFYVINTHHKSQTGKIKVINDFGKTTWLVEDDVKSKTVPSNMQWYNISGLKVAKRGEEEVVDFIANLLNLPWDLTKLSDPAQAFAKFDKEQWAAIFGGDFSYVQGIIEGTNNKIGVALGVKVAVDPELVTTPATGVVPFFTVKLVVLTLLESSASLKLALILVSRTISVAESIGSVELTVGAVVSIIAAVVKDHT